MTYIFVKYHFFFLSLSLSLSLDSSGEYGRQEGKFVEAADPFATTTTTTTTTSGAMLGSVVTLT